MVVYRQVFLIDFSNLMNTWLQQQTLHIYLGRKKDHICFLTVWLLLFFKTVKMLNSRKLLSKKATVLVNESSSTLCMCFTLNNIICLSLQVKITTRDLVSHLSGIRGYNKDYMNSSKEKKNSPTKQSGLFESNSTDETEKDKNTWSNLKLNPEFNTREYFIKRHFSSTNQALELFKADPLVHKPGKVKANLRIQRFFLVIFPFRDKNKCE